LGDSAGSFDFAQHEPYADTACMPVDQANENTYLGLPNSALELRGKSMFDESVVVPEGGF
jgi:L-ascorbate metabolism protein UlaG (beta-lactamase superfamily)